MTIKQSVKISRDTVNCIEVIKSAFDHKDNHVRMTNDDIIKMAVEKLMNDYNIKRLEDIQNIQEEFKQTKMLAKGKGIKVE